MLSSIQSRFCEFKRTWSVVTSRRLASRGGVAIAGHR